MTATALEQKINELFEYRGFPFLYQYSGMDSNLCDDLNRKLIDLQASIYYLDHYLETNWKIEEKAKQKHWQSIEKKLNDLGIAKSNPQDYLKHIKVYERHELQLRKKLLPTRLNTEYYYFYKSCDVKLMRRLLMEKLPNISKLFNTADWRYFDLVTEINDDATDLEEDLETINGNMVLIAYHQFGRDKTISLFVDFLDYCGRESANRFETSTNKYKQKIHKDTLTQIRATKKILKESTILKSKADSVLIKHLNNKP